ncbi:unnamed protein product [Dicrocoelium dendriticum]|nr:unnamed protein product [Dicrocoelium dendriticum]
MCKCSLSPLYELREDRKREVARTIGHLEGLKRELLEEIGKHFSTVKQLVTSEGRKADGRMSQRSTSVHLSPVSADDIFRPPDFVTKTGATQTVARPEEVGTPQQSAQAYSLSYGRETQHIYDEIKQLALINTAYGGVPANLPAEHALHSDNLDQFREDILRGVRNEIRQLLRPTGSAIYDTQTAPVIVRSSECVTCSSTTVCQSASTSRTTPMVTVIAPVKHFGSSSATTTRTSQPPRPLLRQARRSISPAEPVEQQTQVTHRRSEQNTSRTTATCDAQHASESGDAGGDLLSPR